MAENYSESIDDGDGARLEFISVNADTPFMQVKADGAGPQAGQSVSFTFTRRGFAQLLEVAARVFSHNLAP